MYIARSREYSVSVDELCRSTGIGREQLHKLVHRLRNLNLLYFTNSQLRCRLDLDNLRVATDLLPKLRTEVLRYRALYFERTTSTQDIVHKLARCGFEEGYVVIAEEQLRGRGRWGRTWISPKGGLWFSVLLRPKVALPQQISIAASLSVAEVLNDLLKIPTYLKWPNDVVIQGKKVCGVLVESKYGKYGVEYIVLGIGINVNNEIPQELREHATSLRDEVRQQVPRVPVLLSILKQFDQHYKHLEMNRSSEVVTRYYNLLIEQSHKVRIELINGEHIEGKVIGIDIDGSIVLSTEGKEVPIQSELVRKIHVLTE